MDDDVTERKFIARPASGVDHGPRTHLTDRDRELLAACVLARYLSAQQVHRLFFDGHRLQLAYKRLQKLSAPKGQPPFLRQIVFHAYDGRRLFAWTATAHALQAASLKCSHLHPLPTHDISDWTLAHMLQLNELFVSLWRTPGRPARAQQAAFRWIPSDSVKLPYGELNVRRHTVERVIIPDAMLELPQAGRRFFLECETGSNTVSPRNPGKKDATMNKVYRYQTFLEHLHGGRSYRYTNAFPDGFEPEVLFLVTTEARERTINAALGTWRNQYNGSERPAPMRAQTFEAAARRLRTLAGLPALDAPQAPAVPVPVEQPFLTDEDGRALVRFADDAMIAIQQVRHAIRDLPPELKDNLQNHGLIQPAYPESTRAAGLIVKRLKEMGWT